MSKPLLQGMVIALLNVIFASVVYLLARRQALTFRYAVGWLALFGLGALSGLLVPLSAPLAELLGVTPGVVVSAVGVLALLAICVQLSISISGLQEQVRVLAEELALSAEQEAQRATE